VRVCPTAWRCPQLATHAGRVRHGGQDEYIDVTELLTVINERTQEIKPLITSWAKASMEDARRRERREHELNAVGSGRLSVLPLIAAQVNSAEHAMVERELASLDTEAHAALHGHAIESLDRANASMDANAATLKRHLRSFFGEVSDIEKIFRILDASSDMLISEGELRKGLQALGFDAPKEAVSALFDQLDTDGDYKLSYYEFSAWIHDDDAPAAAAPPDAAASPAAAPAPAAAPPAAAAVEPAPASLDAALSREFTALVTSLSREPSVQNMVAQSGGGVGGP
jgi:Ca2+-binding EF-hand superfamily protein